MQEVGNTMSISKSYNKQNGVTYVYEVYENHWNKEKKRPESRRRLIGKIDPETGEIVPTSRAKKRADKKDSAIQNCKIEYEKAKEKILLAKRSANTFPCCAAPLSFIR